MFFLQTNGSGVLSFVNGGGKVLQVLSTTKTDSFSQSATTTFADVTGLTVSITPSSASNKILITGYINTSNNIGNKTAFRLMRNSTSIGGGTATGNTQSAIGNADPQNTDSCEVVAINFLDSPSTTSSTTYKIQMISHSTTGYVNRTSNGTQYDDAEAYAVKFSSTITVMEIAG